MFKLYIILLRCEKSYIYVLIKLILSVTSMFYNTSEINQSSLSHDENKLVNQ